MKKIKLFLLTVVAAMCLTSCEDYFDDVPENATTLDDVFSNRGLTLSWLTNVYSFTPDNTNLRYHYLTNGCWGPACIEGEEPWSNVVANNIILGTLYASSSFPTTLFTEYYRGIQYANIYLANVDRCDAMSQDEKDWTKAECRALRAYFYFNLMKEFGPVPVIGDEVYGVSDPLDKMMIPRSTVDECFDYIISELKAALNSGNLASQFDEAGAYNEEMKGNFTSEVVTGILAEVYLYRASYVFNGDPYYKDLANPDGTKLFPQSRDDQKWRDARDAAKQIIDSGRYRLVMRDASGRQVYDITQSDPFKSVFYASYAHTSNEEMIYGRTSSKNGQQYEMTPRFDNMPSNYNKGAGAYSIPLEFIDLYFTNKGLRIDDDPDYFTYDYDNPPTAAAGKAESILRTGTQRDKFSGSRLFSAVYGYPVMKQFYNREPRFYLAVSFQNRPWDFDKNTPIEMQYNGNCGYNGSNSDFPMFGTIVRKGYYEKESGWAAYEGPDALSMMLRLGEVYLNYAEACCELGELGEAIHYVNLIRSRAGIAEYYGLNAEDQTETDARGEKRIHLSSYDQDMVRKVVYRERLIELAYEDKHYFDVRRWGVADMAQGDGWIYPAYHQGGEGGEMHGFNVYDVDVTLENKNVNFYKRKVQQVRVFTKRMTFFPIPQDEVYRNHNCVQNTGWESAELE